MRFDPTRAMEEAILSKKINNVYFLLTEGVDFASAARAAEALNPVPVRLLG